MVFLTSAVAAIVVIIAGLISYPLVRSAEVTQSQNQLSRLADLTAAAIDRGVPTGGHERDHLVPPSLSATLRSEQVQGYLVFDPSAAVPGVPQEEVRELLEHGTLSTEGDAGEGRVFVEGRSLASGGALILEQPVAIAGGFAQAGLLRFLMALFIGLLVAIPIGYFAATRMVRPLRAARDAAYEMQAGSRDVRLEPEGPSEVAEVKGYAEALADDVIEPQDVAKTGATVAAEAQRLDRLVSDLLDLARLGAVDFHVNPASVDLKDIGLEAAEVWSTRCEREDVRFEQELPADELLVVTDPMRLRQIIDNLSENALRVSPSGSVVVLAMRQVSDGVEVEVRDSGPGLTSDDMAIAFEPGALYERYRGVRPVGTGLGLALVGRLAAGLGGYARVTTAPEGGACFTVFLPSVQPSPIVDLV